MPALAGAARARRALRRTAAVALIIAGVVIGAELCRMREGLAVLAAALLAPAVRVLGHTCAHSADHAAPSTTGPATPSTNSFPPAPSPVGAAGSATRAAGPLPARQQRKGRS
ncbi:hypothetical protein QC281_00895 [Streptomyces sp. DH17]|nr:hypothetical protein [Streptomyces sp. DH17]